MNKEDLQLLHTFVKTCQVKPEILNLPELSFYKTWLESLGAKIPAVKKCETNGPCGECPSHKEKPKPYVDPEVLSEDEDCPESELELDRDGVVEPDSDIHQSMGDESIEITDEMLEASSSKRDEAVAAVSDGDLEKAISCYTEAIINNPTSANLYAKRASIFIKSLKPNAAIKDCNKALELNSDSAQPYKWRGKAYRLLGEWENAYKDLSKSCQLDYDDDANECRREVEPKAKRVLEHKRKQERKKEENELKHRRERIQKAKEENEKARKDQESRSGHSFPGMSGGFPGAFPGAMPGMPDLSSLFSDPELLQAFQDPEVAAAFQDITSNPANISKYQNNPKIHKIIEKMSNKFQGPNLGDMDLGGDGDSTVPETAGSSSASNVPPQPDID